MEDVDIYDNVAFGDALPGGGLRAMKMTGEFTRVVFRNNTGVTGGGAVAFGSNSRVNISSCSFTDNKAHMNGGSVFSDGQDTEVKITSTTIQGSRAFEGEGGAIYMSGESRMTLSHVIVAECNAGSNGGGLGLRGDSVISLMDVTIRQCQARVMGGGLLTAGDSVIFKGDVGSRVLIEKNKARLGGGITYMSRVHLDGQSTGLIRDNEALENGGGVFGFSSYAKLTVMSSYKLQIQGNIAGDNGGGICLKHGAQMSVEPPKCSSSCSRAVLGNDVCDMDCMSAGVHACIDAFISFIIFIILFPIFKSMCAGCDWDGGDCNYLFEDASAHALQSCQCSPTTLHGGPPSCAPRHRDVGNGNEWDNLCFSASCDWSPYVYCDPTREKLGLCPMIDALVHQVLVSTPGLVYMKEGKGFTAPDTLTVEGGEPWPYWQGVGRCVNTTACQTGPPPAGGVRALDPDESWCGTGGDSGVSANFHGRVLKAINLVNTCVDPIFEGYACEDVGKAWGVCTDRPRVPSLGLDYDPQYLRSVARLSIRPLFDQHPGCGSLPLVVTSNRAGQYGGGLYLQDCDVGFAQKKLCWIGGIDASTSASYLMSFEGNRAGAAGGGIYTSCFSLGKCQEVMNRTLGLPMASGRRVKMLSLVENVAGGFGNDVATAPATITVVSHGQGYVPGQTSIDITFSLFDAQGRIVVGSPSMPIAHQVQLLVLPVDAICSTFEACERMKMQPTGTRQMEIRTCMHMHIYQADENTHVHVHAHAHIVSYTYTYRILSVKWDAGDDVYPARFSPYDSPQVLPSRSQQSQAPLVSEHRYSKCFHNLCVFFLGKHAQPSDTSDVFVISNR